MKLWINSFAPFMSGGKKLYDLPQGTIVEIPAFQSIGDGTVLHKGVLGKVDPKYLEPYLEYYDKACVDVSDIETPNDDAAQFIVWDGVKQVNMCGQLSVCFVMNDWLDEDVKLSDFLLMWEVKDLPFWKRVFSGGKARGTYPKELVDMFAVFGYKARELTGHPALPLKRYTPYHLSNLDAPIVSVKIDGNTGRLRGSGIGHWVVVREVTMERTGYGFVTIYNPFPNRIEVYSWNEFIASAGSYPYGAVLEKTE